MAQLKSSPTLRQSLTVSAVAEDGLKLATHVTTHYKGVDQFARALHEQKKAIEFQPANGLKGVTEEGYIMGSNLRLTEDAFNDLCHATRTPVSFIKALSRRNPRLALEAVSEMVASMFNGDANLLIVDSRDNLVSNIVGKDGYNPTTTADILEWTLSAGDYEMTNGWVCGPHSRFTVVAPKSDFEPRKGDIVHHGVSVNNALYSDVEIGSYFERLVCTNGMTARDAQSSQRVSHAGNLEDLQIAIQAALVGVTAHAHVLQNASMQAASHLMLAQQVRAVRNWIREPTNGGGQRLDTQVVTKAIQEAKDEGRAEDEVTLWNFVNGINYQAHAATALNKRVSLESMAHNALLKFAGEFCSN